MWSWKPALVLLVVLVMLVPLLEEKEPRPRFLPLRLRFLLEEVTKSED